MGELEDRFRAARAYAGQSQTTLGTTMGGLTKDAVINYENGKYRNEHDQLAAIQGYAKACGLAPEWFTADWSQLEPQYVPPENRIEALGAAVEQLDGRFEGLLVALTGKQGAGSLAEIDQHLRDIDERMGAYVEKAHYEEALDLLRQAVDALNNRLPLGKP